MYIDTANQLPLDAERGVANPVTAEERDPQGDHAVMSPSPASHHRDSPMAERGMHRSVSTGTTASDSRLFTGASIVDPGTHNDAGPPTPGTTPVLPAEGCPVTEVSESHQNQFQPPELTGTETCSAQPAGRGAAAMDVDNPQLVSDGCNIAHTAC